MAMTTIPNIFIVGAFGVGKSTIAQTLAKLLERECFDTDRLLEEQVGVDLAWLFDVEGQEKFLQRELKLLETWVKKPNIVLATGGTTVLLSKARKLLKDNGIVIGLKASLSYQIKRIQEVQYKRPLICKDPALIQQNLEAFCTRYDSLYQEVAEVFFDSDHKNPKITANIIFRYLKSRQHAKRTA